MRWNFISAFFFDLRTIDPSRSSASFSRWSTILTVILGLSAAVASKGLEASSFEPRSGVVRMGSQEVAAPECGIRTP